MTSDLPAPGPDLQARLARVRLFLCDVDGVLTDGTVLMGAEFEAKSFNILDGLGLRILQRQGIRVGWISGRPSPATLRRAEDLQIDFVRQGDQPKAAVIDELLASVGLGWEAVCYAGDDLLDLAPLRRAGVAVAVANAIPEAKALAHYVTRAGGGRGAVREAADLILKAQGRWEAVVESYSALS